MGPQYWEHSFRIFDFLSKMTSDAVLQYNLLKTDRNFERSSKWNFFDISDQLKQICVFSYKIPGKTKRTFVHTKNLRIQSVKARKWDSKKGTAQMGKNNRFLERESTDTSGVVVFMLKMCPRMTT